MENLSIWLNGGTILSVLILGGKILWTLAGISKDVEYLKENGLKQLREKHDRCQANHEWCKKDKDKRLRDLELRCAKYDNQNRG